MEQQRKREAASVQSVQREEMLPVALYEEVLKKIEEIFAASLKIESSSDLESVLSGTSMVKAKVEEIIEKLKNDVVIAERERVYEEDKGVGNEA